MGGQAVCIQNGKATLAGSDIIAGSAVDLTECCRRAISFGISIEQAVTSSSLTPAWAAGLVHEVGQQPKWKKSRYRPLGFIE